MVGQLPVINVLVAYCKTYLIYLKATVLTCWLKCYKIKLHIIQIDKIALKTRKGNIKNI